MKLNFLYSSGDYKIIKQFFVYDLGAFIADFGGYLVKKIHLMATVLDNYICYISGPVLGCKPPNIL